MGLIVVPVHWGQVASVYALEHEEPSPEGDFSEPPPEGDFSEPPPNGELFDGPPPHGEYFDGHPSDGGFVDSNTGEFVHHVGEVFFVLQGVHVDHDRRERIHVANKIRQALGELHLRGLTWCAPPEERHGRNDIE